MQPWYHHPTARRYIVSYLLISVLPILGLGFLFCYRQARNVQTSQQQWAADCTRQISDAFEANLQAVETAAIHFSTNHGGALAAASADEIIPRQLATYKQAYALPGDLLLYPRGTNVVYTPDARLGYQQFHSMVPYRYELDRISFFTRINTISSSLYMSSYGFQEESNYFLFLNPIPYLDASPTATMVYIIGLSGFNAMITDYLGAFTGYFCVLDAAGRVSYILNRYGGHSADSIRLAVSALRGTPTVEHAIDGERFVTTRILSGARHFTYLLSIPQAALGRALWQALWIYGTGTLLLALFAGAVSVWLARRQFLPITQLEQALSEEDAAQREAQEDIFEAIRRRYDSIQSKNEQLVLQLQSHAALARGKLFDDLLTGRIRDDEQLTHALQLGNIRFDAGGFFVVVGQLLGAQGRSGMASEAAPFFGEILFRFGKAYGVETGDGNRLAFVVNAGRGAEPPEDVLFKTAVLFRDELMELGFRVASVGVSGMHSSALRLNLSLFEALAAMEGGGEGIHRFVKREEDQSAPYRFAICELYRQGLQYGSADMALTTLNKMAENLRGRNLPLAQQQAFCFMLVNLLLDFCEKNNLPLDAVDLTLAASQADLDAFLALAEASTRQLCGRVEAERERQRAAIHREIIEYIHEHISQQSLTVDSVADAFQLSGSYVRKLIKDATGDSFSSYVTGLRFAYVKRSLAETDTPIREIIKAAGYVDVSSFTRKFKAQEGVTPGQYRTLSQAMRQK